MTTSNRNYELKNLRSVENRKSSFSFKIFIFLPDLLPWMDTRLPPTYTPVSHQTVFSSHTFVRCHSWRQLELEMVRVTDTADIGVTKIPMQCMMVLSMTISWSLVYSEYMQNQRACVFWRKNEVHKNNPHSLQKWKTVFKGKLLIFQEKKSVYVKTYIQQVQSLLRRRSVPWDSSIQWWKLKGMGKLESKLNESHKS
jgi:hypothetical protein